MHWGNEYVHDVIERAADRGRRAGRGGGPRRPDRRTPRARRAADLTGGPDVGGVGHGQPAVEQPAAGLLPRRRDPTACSSPSTSLTRRRRACVGVARVRFTPTWNERTSFRVLPVAATLVDPALPPTSRPTCGRRSIAPAATRAGPRRRRARRHPRVP